MKQTEIIFVHPYYQNTRCHAKVVDKLSVEDNRNNYIATYEVGKSLYAVYKTYGTLFRKDYNNFDFEAIKVK